MELRQLKNVASVTGTLKSLEVSRGVYDGISNIKLTMTIESTVGDKVHENKIRCSAKQTSKLYKSYETIEKDYKTTEKNGKGDKINVQGSYELTEFVTDNGDILSYPSIRGVFVNRVNDSSKQIDQSGLVMECIVESVTPEDKNGMPTGRLKVKLLTVGYGQRVSEFTAVVDEKLAKAFERSYKPGCTAELVFNINRYAEVSVEENETPEALFFGEELPEMPNTTVTKFVSELAIIGGKQPMIVGAGAYTLDETAELLRLRAIKIDELNSEALNKLNTQVDDENPFGEESSSSIYTDEIPF